MGREFRLVELDSLGDFAQVREPVRQLIDFDI
jgi:hypothetical protein